MDGVTTYQEFEQRNDQLENQYGYSSEQVLLEVTLNSSAAEMMPKIIALNKRAFVFRKMLNRKLELKSIPSIKFITEKGQSSLFLK